MTQIYKNRTVAVAELVPNARNARTHSAEQVGQIAASISKFGFTNPVLIDETMAILAGHGRILAAQQLGMEKVPCVIIRGLSDHDKRLLMLADNKIALNAGWDLELLKLELGELAQDVDVDLSITGFSDDELAGLKISDEELMPMPGLSSGAGITSLKWGDLEVPMSDVEFETLTQRYRAYYADKGIAYGFVRALLNLGDV